MRTGKPLLLILGSLAALMGLALLAAGLGVTWAHTTSRDADGYYMTPEVDLTTDAIAIISEEIRLDARPTDWWPAPGELPVRVRVEPDVAGDEVFVGIADADALTGYLDDVDHVVVTGLRTGPLDDEVTYEREEGAAAPAPPGDAGIWEASSSGSGTQVLTVDPTPGDWQLVVMNADGSPGVAVTAAAGVRTSVLLPIGIGLLVLSLLTIAGAAGILVAAAAVRGTPASEAPVAPTTRPAVAFGEYPVALQGRLDPQLSRGLWLVKWLLAIPHFVVLALLWVAYVLLTIVAGIAILFTGQYPRSIFDVTVGILRWSWRVSYYATGVLGTDRYPPFTLEEVPDYPATLDVAYPAQLSRGLVLVKWWLLALPHLIIVGIFTGGWVSWTRDVGAPDGAQVVAGTGLIGVLVFVAGVVLLVTGRYPRGLFDLVMGLQRWVYRVVAYVSLMTDEYPPFRLDTGGGEPARPPSEPPASAPPARGSRDVVHH